MESKEVIMVGAGGHALSLAEFAEPLIYGYLANEENPEMPSQWLGKDDDLASWIDAGKKFHMAFVYSGLPVMSKREALIRKYEEAGARFASLIAPSSIITPHSEIGEGSAVMAGSIVNRALLGRNVIVNSGAIVEHDCKVGDNTFIGPGAVIGGFTSVGSNCFIGLGARIANGITIASGITVAMGAIVSRSLTEPGIYHGSPLRLFKLKNR
ncbi:MAG: hypothetical protein J1F16_05935 [Muribaculaceae bacterium]|nr:hypothetical protein [Muribaculaceae bacterium]